MKSFGLVLSDVSTATQTTYPDLTSQAIDANFVIKIILIIALIMFIIASLVFIFLAFFCFHLYRFSFKKVKFEIQKLLLFKYFLQ